MSTHKKIDIICVAAILFAVILTVLFMNGRDLGITLIQSEETDDSLFTANDRNADWNTSSATKISLSDGDSTVYGNGAYVYDGDVYIIRAGYYVLSGELTNGSIIIDADRSDKIWMLLDGVTLYCDDDAAIRIEQAEKVFLTLAEGTENEISVGTQYNAEALASGVDGAIYSRDDLTINGNGALFVTAGYQHGIVCNDDLVIAGGNMAISAVQDGIHANDSVRIRDASILISAGDDGITVSNDDETAFLYVESGNITITDCYEGMEAIDITIAGGTIQIMPTDDGINANGTGANSVIRITGGDIAIINDLGRDADGLDSNGDIYIEGGRVFVSVSGSGGNCALDYGSENGGVCVISGGTVIACGGSTMAESFDAGSTQGFLTYNGNAAAGTVISLTDSDGRELLSEEIPCSFSHVVLSTPDLKIGDVCTIMIDGVEELITVNNTSSSGFGMGGMFGGGMRQDFSSQAGGRDMESFGGRGKGAFNGQGMEAFDGQGMEPPEDQGMEAFEGQGMEPPEDQGMEAFDGQRMEPPEDQGMEAFDGQRMEPPEGQGMEVFEGQGIESPDGQGMEPTDGQGMEAFDGQRMEAPEDQEMSFPDRADLPDGENRPDSEEAVEAGGRSLAPDAGQGRGNGMHTAWQEQSQTQSGSDRLSPGISVETLVLLGISMLVLLSGLMIAIKIRH